MPTYVALLRAINLGPRNRVAMPELRAALERAGFAGVVTHLNTGNVVLRSGRRSTTAVGAEVEALLRDELGVGVDVIMRTAAQLRALADGGHEFDGPESGPRSLHVGFLGSEPAAAARARLDDQSFPTERFALRGRELHLLYPDGMGRSKMTGALLERLLGVPLTVRSMAVVRKVAELAT